MAELNPPFPDSMLEDVGDQVPVTALAFCGSLLLSGAGPYLSVYEWRTGHLLHRSKIFRHAAIHGLRTHETGDQIVFAWGGATVSVLRLLQSGSDLTVIHLVESYSCPDWILEAELRPAVSELATGSTTIEVAVVTAHNALLLLTVLDKEVVAVLAANVHSRSILYSAKLSWESSGRLLVASGTVFGQIILWSASIEAGQIGTDLHSVFVGHEGSPFGLAFSGPTHVNGDRVRLLVSCSDDRSLRLWNISNPREVSEFHGTDLPDASTLVEHTGFDAKASSPSHLVKKCIAHGRGHLSRIWGVEFLPSPKSECTVDLITFGEDATYMSWTFDLSTIIHGDFSTRPDVVQSGSLAAHSGQNIWSHACTERSSNGEFIASGGADGSVVLANISALRLPLRSVESQDISRSLTARNVPKRHRSSVRTFAHIDSHSILMVSETGKLYTAMFDSEGGSVDVDSSACSRIPFDDEADVMGFCVMASIESRSMVIVSGKSGSVFSFHPATGMSRVACEGNKVSALIPIRPFKSRHHEEHEGVLVTRHGIQHAEVICYNETSGIAVHSGYLQLPNGEIITSAAVLIAHERTSWLLGSRTGTLHHLMIDEGDADAEPTLPAYPPSNSYEAHADAITDVAALEIEKQILVLCTCRDGSLAIYTADPLENGHCLQLVHHLAVSGLTDARQICVASDLTRISICGFKRKSFCIVGLLDEQELTNIDCSGSNRAWSYVPAAADDHGSFAWLQASKLHWQKRGSTSPLRIHAGFHGREVKAVAAASTESTNSGLIATGGEDTDIKLGRLEPDALGSMRYRCLRTVRKHNTGIQDLAWAEDGQRLISCGGFEELFVWRIRRLPLLEVGVMCESICPFLSDVPDLRVTSIALHTCAGFSGKDGAALTIAACRSDSTVHVYHYKVENGVPAWTCQFAGQYTTCSLTKLVLRPIGGRLNMVALATDGHGVRTLIPSESRDTTTTTTTTTSAAAEALTWTSRSKMHQSAILSSRAVAWKQHEIFLVTGGDDNAISITRLGSSLAREDLEYQSSTLTIPRAHAAAVTGVEVVHVDTELGVFWIASAGLDQKVKLWGVTVDDSKAGVEGVDVKRLLNAHTPVADIGDVCSWQEDGCTWILLCGVGWDLKRVKQ